MVIIIACSLNGHNWECRELEEKKFLHFNRCFEFHKPHYTGHFVPHNRRNHGSFMGKFLTRVISREGYHKWPPRSCDLTICKFFLWVYANSFAAIILASHSAIWNGKFHEKDNVLYADGHLADVIFHHQWQTLFEM